MGSADPLGKMDEKLKAKACKKSSLLNILGAIRVGRCRGRRYAGHIFIQIYFRMHHLIIIIIIISRFV